MAEPEQMADLTDDERRWVEADERLWREAHSIQAGRPELDLYDIYHTLRQLQRSPTERLRRGLLYGRACAQR